MRSHQRRLRVGIQRLRSPDAYEKACGRELPYEIVERRPGDIATSYADTEKAKRLLGFETELGIEQMCLDSYRFSLMNPDGIN